MVDKGAETEKAVLVLVTKLRELLKELPPENLATLKFTVQHLRRIVEAEQENKMTSGNLGIVFGPTLMRPRPTEATISLSSLVDYPHQARIVEALIIFYPAIFETDQTFADGLEASAEEDEEDRRELIRNQEDTCVQPHDGVPYLVTTPEQAEAAFQEGSYGEPQAHFIDSDSDLEDGVVPGMKGDPQTGIAQHSESSGDEETHSAGEASEEGTRNWRCSVGQSDSEDIVPPHQEEGSCDAEEDTVFGKEGEAAGGGLLAGCNTNQSNNTPSSRLLFGCKMLG